MSHFGRTIPNLAEVFMLKFRKHTRFTTKSCYCGSVTYLSTPIRYRIENIISTAHLEGIISG